jgi:hypothetical protein
MNVFGVSIDALYLLIALFAIIAITVVVTLLIAKKITVAFSVDLKAFWSFMKEGLSEDNGHASSTRINQLFANILFSPTIAYGFLYVLWNHTELVLIYLASMLAAMGLTQGLKVWQKKNEQPIDAPFSETSTSTEEVKR